MNKYNIDKLFQEKFKDFGEVPDEKVWSSIETSLDQKKKKRRVVPIWWKLGGVAAILAILFIAINPFGDLENTDVQVTDVEQNNTPDTDNPNDSGNDILNPSDKTVDAVVSADDEDDGISDKKSSTLRKEQPALTSGTDSDKGKVADGDQEENKFEQVNGRAINKDSQITSKEQDRNIINRGDNSRAEKISTEIANDISVDAVADNVIKSNKEKVLDRDIIDNGAEKNAIENVISENGVAQAENGEKKEEQIDISEKKSIFDEIKEAEAVADADNAPNKWSIGPSVAPVYFDSFGEGSPIHSSFVANTKSGNINLSYGLAVEYEVSKKLSIRSGVHKVDYGYDTNDILFSSSLAASTNNQIENIDYVGTSKNLVVQSSSGNNNAVAEDFIQVASNEIAAPNPSRNGRMVQQFGYLEVPVELNYALVDKKLGINLIGGMSSLFLVNNSVILESDGSATEMGEANNINNLNFSTNIGLGINYELSPKMRVNLEPMFKYQLNTFSESAGNFQPFSVGVYSGISFKF